MKKSSPLALLLPLLILHGLFFHGKVALAEGTEDGSEEWGYVEVRPKAHMFWWLYWSPQKAKSPSSPWPTVLWLQGGPGASGAGMGNFLEIGPLDSNLKPRNSTWLQKADLLFVELLWGTVGFLQKILCWGGQSNLVFSGLYNDFMKPRINEVDELLSNGLNVTIYNGQLDVICATKGAEAWVQKLKWDGLKNFTNLNRTPLYCNSGPQDTKAFTKSYKNLNFYWILGAGHFVPAEQPCIALQMIGEITHSPATTSSDRKNGGT